jgi:hypothetical protein
MATKNPRINVTFEETTASLLSDLAHQAHGSVSSVVRKLTLEALEMREDFYLSKVATMLDKEGAKTYAHDDAWK